jgi:uracil-DNA glycosylase
MPELDIVCPPTYPAGAKVVFCGEAPGEDECRLREGFVGKAGNLLQKIAGIGGLNWSQIARTNVVKRPPEGGYDSEHFRETFYETTREGRKKVTRCGSELVEWRNLLRNELLDKKPNLVVACGNEALSALCGVEGISKYRGSILASSLVNGLKVIPIMHPSWVLRSAQFQEVYIASEICRTKIVPQSVSPKLNYLGWEEITHPTIDDVQRFIQQIVAVGKPFTLDIETRAGSIACVGLAYRERDGNDRAICIPIQTTVGPYFTLEEEFEFWRALQYLLSQLPVVGHNIFYDLAWLREYGMSPSDVQDTMILFHRFFPELPKGLDFVNMWFTDIPYYKDDGKTWGRNKPDEQLWLYNIKDVVSDLRVWLALEDLSLRPGFKKAREIYDNYTRPIMPIAFEMQSIGMHANADGVDIARSVLTAELDKIRGRLEVITDGALAVRPGNKKITDKQVMDYLYGTLKLPPKKNRKTKSLTADEDALIELLIEFPDQEVLKAINAERKFGKAMNSYIDINWKETT